MSFAAMDRSCSGFPDSGEFAVFRGGEEHFLLGMKGSAKRWVD